MALGGGAYSPAELTRTKGAMEAFLADKSKLKRTRELLRHQDAPSLLSPAQATTLRMFERTFGCYIMGSARAAALREENTALEAALESARNAMRLGATIGGHFLDIS